jgi:hypothetical protein
MRMMVTLVGASPDRHDPGRYMLEPVKIRPIELRRHREGIALVPAEWDHAPAFVEFVRISRELSVSVDDGAGRERLTAPPSVGNLDARSVVVAMSNIMRGSAPAGNAIEIGFVLSSRPLPPCGTVTGASASRPPAQT